MSIKATDKGAPIYLKDNAWANKFFGLDTFAPKAKFNFMAFMLPKKHIIAPELWDIKDFVHLVKTFEPPKPNMDVEIVDQYNKRRIIQRKITWDPITITFHDDRSSKLFALLMDYMSFHFKEFKNTSLNDWKLDTVTDLVNDTDWGLRTSTDKYYFRTLGLIWMAGGRGTLVGLHNPVISNIQFDQLDYADGSTPLEISVTFEYEGISNKTTNAEIDGGSLGLAKLLMGEMNEIGEPMDNEEFHPGASFPGKDRSPGLGELFAAGASFYGKHNGKPTVKDLVDDLILRPAKGVASSSINSWGNFNFGGIDSATKNVGGLLGGAGNVVGNQVGDVFKVANSGTIIQDVFKFGSGGSSGG